MLTQHSAAPDWVHKSAAMVVALPMPEEEADFETIRLEDQARLDGVRLAARTLEHHLTNDLTLTVGYAELIAEDPELPSRLREMAQIVLESAQAAVERVRRMRQVESVTLIDIGVPGGPLLDDGSRPAG
jgi:nitrogen-specific signal transduction histidine kinase